MSRSDLQVARLTGGRHASPDACAQVHHHAAGGHHNLDTAGLRTVPAEQLHHRVLVSVSECSLTELLTWLCSLCL